MVWRSGCTRQELADERNRCVSDNEGPGQHAPGLKAAGAGSSA